MRTTARARWMLLPAAALLVALAAWAGDRGEGTAAGYGAAPGEDGAASSEGAAPAWEAVPAAPSASGAAPGGGGLVARIDPRTGRLIHGPGGGEVETIAPGLADRFETYGGDLIQEPLPAGGFKVDLRGRFQSSVVATIDPESGEVEIDCVTTTGDGEAGDGR